MHNMKEEVYDARLYPLIEQIAAIAKEYDISLVIAADIGRDDFDRQKVASTILLFDECHHSFLDAKHVLEDGFMVVAPTKEEDIFGEDGGVIQL